MRDEQNRRTKIIGLKDVGYLTTPGFNFGGAGQEPPAFARTVQSADRRQPFRDRPRKEKSRKARRGQAVPHENVEDSVMHQSPELKRRRIENNESSMDRGVSSNEDATIRYHGVSKTDPKGKSEKKDRPGHIPVLANGSDCTSISSFHSSPDRGLDDAPLKGHSSGLEYRYQFSFRLGNGKLDFVRVFIDSRGRDVLFVKIDFDHHHRYRRAAAGRETRSYHLAHIWDVVTMTDGTYAVHEKMEVTLADVVRSNAILEDRILEALVRQILEMLNSHEVRNLDVGRVAPSDIWLNWEGRIKLARWPQYLISNKAVNKSGSTQTAVQTASDSPHLCTREGIIRFLRRGQSSMAHSSYRHRPGVSLDYEKAIIKILVDRTLRDVAFDRHANDCPVRLTVNSQGRAEVIRDR